MCYQNIEYKSMTGRARNALVVGSKVIVNHQLNSGGAEDDVGRLFGTVGRTTIRCQKPG